MANNSRIQNHFNGKVPHVRWTPSYDMNETRQVYEQIESARACHTDDQIAQYLKITPNCLKHWFDVSAKWIEYSEDEKKERVEYGYSLDGQIFVTSEWYFKDIKQDLPYVKDDFHDKHKSTWQPNNIRKIRDMYSRVQRCRNEGHTYSDIAYHVNLDSKDKEQELQEWLERAKRQLDLADLEEQKFVETFANVRAKGIDLLHEEPDLS